MSAFDDLARNLASPMPRRRVLQIAVGALVAGVLPGGGTTAAPAATTRAWRTAGCGKGGGGLSCAAQFEAPITECCGPIDKSNPESNYTCCPPGECWHHGTGSTSSTTCCPPKERCGLSCCGSFQTCDRKLKQCVFCEGGKCADGSCCPKTKGRCVKGACCPLKRTTFAPGTNKKRVACCPPGTVAVPGGVGECCPKNDPDCCKTKDPDPDDDLAPLGKKLNRGQLCVNGKVTKA